MLDNFCIVTSKFHFGRSKYMFEKLFYFPSKDNAKESWFKVTKKIEFLHVENGTNVGPEKEQKEKKIKERFEPELKEEANRLWQFRKDTAINCNASTPASPKNVSLWLIFL